VKAEKVQPSWVEPEQVITLLEGAPKGRKPIVATLAGAGSGWGRRLRSTGAM
jgi:hypothetical protein